MDRPRLFPPEAAVGHPVAAAIGASLGSILTAHLNRVALVANGRVRFPGR